MDHPRLIDTHTHLYVDQFDKDREQVIENAVKSGVERFFLPNIDNESIDRLLALESRHPSICHPMMGLHPCSVKSNYKEVLTVIKSWLYKRPFCAVGEIGMDLYWDKTFKNEQIEAFLLQSEWAIALNLPIVIHSRESTSELIDLIKNINDSRLKGIFHCFGGNIKEAEQIIDLGFYLGIGGVVTFKKAGLDKTLEKIDLQNIVLETDSPYLAPTPYRGKRNESSYLSLIAQRIADIKNTTVEEVGRITSENALRIFKMTDVIREKV